MIGVAGPAGLTTGGAIFITLAWGGILGLTIFCFYRIFSTRDRQK
ncbi:MAG: hypothetical protein O7A63_01135 [Acidobacteria bacterium]|nr:hypothetical protein [Acidobacteriota bacterium]